MENGNKRLCKFCGKPFVPVRPWQEYHDLACGNKARGQRRYKRVQQLIKEADARRAAEAGEHNGA